MSSMVRSHCRFPYRVAALTLVIGILSGASALAQGGAGGAGGGGMGGGGMGGGLGGMGGGMGSGMSGMGGLGHGGDFGMSGVTAPTLDGGVGRFSGMGAVTGYGSGPMFGSGLGGGAGGFYGMNYGGGTGGLYGPSYGGGTRGAYGMNYGGGAGGFSGLNYGGGIRDSYGMNYGGTRVFYGQDDSDHQGYGMQANGQPFNGYSRGFGYPGNRYYFEGSYGWPYYYPYSNPIFGAPSFGFGYSAAPVPPATSPATRAEGQRPYLGIDEEPVVDPDGRKGLKVARVYPGTAAERAGLQPGDIIHSINGFLTEQRGNLAWIIANARYNSTLNINVHKVTDNRDHTVAAQLP